jgi:hypothetical protein
MRPIFTARSIILISFCPRRQNFVHFHRQRQNFDRWAGWGVPLAASWAGALMQMHHLHHLKAAPDRIIHHLSDNHIVQMCAR